MLHLELTTAPPMLPVTLDELKLHAGADGDDLDTLLLGYITTATELWQNETGEQLITADYRQSFALSELEISQPLYLAKPPLLIVTEITYLDSEDEVQTVDVADYTYRYNVTPGYVVFHALPSDVSVTVPDPVSIHFTCGYGFQDQVPEAARLWILGQAAHFYRNREAGAEKSFNDAGYERLIAQHRSWRLGRK